MSLYNWYKTLIALRRDNPALRDGSNIMLNTSDTKVLSYLGKNTGNGSSVLVTINFTAQPQVVSVSLKDQGIAGSTAKTLLQDGAMKTSVSLDHIELSPFSAYIGEVQR